MLKFVLTGYIIPWVDEFISHEENKIELQHTKASSHNHGSVENDPILKETNLARTHFQLPLKMGGRVKASFLNKSQERFRSSSLWAAKNDHPSKANEMHLAIIISYKFHGGTQRTHGQEKYVDCMSRL